jgi:hypothetical protein
MTGTQWNPVRDVDLSGITFQASSITYMDPHGVPSAGDWALERMGAVFLQGTEGATISECVFDRLDGHGVMISGYNRNATVQDSVRNCFRDSSWKSGTLLCIYTYVFFSSRQKQAENSNFVL